MKDYTNYQAKIKQKTRVYIEDYLSLGTIQSRKGTPMESKLERPFRGTRGKGVGGTKYATEHHIFKFVENKDFKTFL